MNVEAQPSDLPPVVNAGSNQTITLGQVATLSGTVTQTTTNPLTDQWTQQSGPGTAIWTNAQSPSTTVQFTAAGTYVLDLSATDGTMAGSSTVTITVNPASTPSTTSPPVVSAGSNQTISQTATATLSGTVTYTAQSGATLSTVWQLANGPGTVTFGNSASPQTTATFSAAGTYYLRLLATYAGVSDQSYTIITVNSASSRRTSTLQQGLNSYSGQFGQLYRVEDTTSTNYSTEHDTDRSSKQLESPRHCSNGISRPRVSWGRFNRPRSPSTSPPPRPAH